MAVVCRPSEASRLKVKVVLRASRSTSPDCSAVKRCCAFSGTYFTLAASPSTAAAVARHRSTSRPRHWPAESAALKPARPVLTPHTSWPRDLLPSSVLPARAGRLQTPSKLRAKPASSAEGRVEEREVGRAG